MAIVLAGGFALIGTNTAEASPSGFGIRGGLTDDPDTFFFGGHLTIHPRRARMLRIEPSVELGIGDDSDLFTIRGNLNFKYLFPLSRDAAVYPLFGPSLYYFDCGDNCDDTEFGLNLGGGIAFSGFAFDLVFGLPDDNVPDIAFTFSYTFW